MQCIQSFAKGQNLKILQFTAIGAFSKVTLGFFDFAIEFSIVTLLNNQVNISASHTEGALI